MTTALPRRERELLDGLISLGKGSAEEIRATLIDPPSNSAVRAMLARLQSKGLVKHQLVGGRYIYSLKLPVDAARKEAMSNLLKTYFKDSAAKAAVTFLGMSRGIEESELAQIEELIRTARKNRK